MIEARRLPRNVVDRYEEEGFIFPVAALDENEVAIYRQWFERVEHELHMRERTLLWTNLHLSFRWAYNLATHPTVLDAVEDLIGPQFSIYSTLVFVKSAGAPSFVSWHQDGQFLLRSSQPMRALTAWIALSPSTAANGCLQIIPRSHRKGRLLHASTYAGDNLLLRGETVQGNVEEDSSVCIELKPGEMSLHHVDVIHGSKPNHSDEPRIGFTVRYLPPTVVPSKAHSGMVPARGGGHANSGSAPPRGRAFLDEVADHIARVERAWVTLAQEER